MIIYDKTGITMKKTSILAVLTALLFFQACASMRLSNKQKQIQAAVPATQQTQAPVTQQTQAPVPQQQSATAPDDYMLGPDDVINITIEQHPEWSGDYTVNPQGVIFISSIGEIKIEGMSKYGAEIALSGVLEKFINNPKVKINITKFSSQVIYVFGEIAAPGKYPTSGKNITLRDAVIMAGLPTRFAATNRVYVISSSKEKPKEQVVNLKRILYKGELANNITLKSGDIVYVPSDIFGLIAEFFSTLLSPITNVIPAARSAVAPIP
jgi:polysaccharide biosynthesis/export protein